MRSQQDICILCRSFRPIYSRPRGRRTASSSARPRGDTFNASKLVLDLEAADSKYVRRYEEQQVGDEIDDASPHPFHGKAKLRVAESKIKGRPAFMRNLMRPNAWRPTGADYLVFVLLGDPFHNSSTTNRPLREVFRMNMINTKIGTFKDHMKLLR